MSFLESLYYYNVLSKYLLFFHYYISEQTRFAYSDTNMDLLILQNHLHTSFSRLHAQKYSF